MEIRGKIDGEAGFHTAPGKFLRRHAQIGKAEGLITERGGDLGPMPGGRIDHAALDVERVDGLRPDNPDSRVEILPGRP
jgi:hypothetical protein